MELAQVAFCSQTNSKHINTAWAKRTVVKMFSLLAHYVTSRLKMVNYRWSKFTC
jgi:hypothetical protein